MGRGGGFQRVRKDFLFVKKKKKKKEVRLVLKYNTSYKSDLKKKTFLFVQNDKD